MSLSGQSSGPCLIGSPDDRRRVTPAPTNKNVSNKARPTFLWASFAALARVFLKYKYDMVASDISI